jgi:hypothetical protein
MMLSQIVPAGEPGRAAFVPIGTGGPAQITAAAAERFAALAVVNAIPGAL